MASVIVKEENYSDDLLACRICLASDVKLFHIRKWGIDQMFIDLMGTTVSACDGLPQHACAWCRALLLRARELRARCCRAQRLLEDALTHQHSITTSYIRSVDRKLHQLSYTYTQNYISDVKVFKYEDMQTETKIDISPENIIESYIKNDNDVTYDDDDVGSDTHSDVKPKVVYVEFEDAPRANIVESDQSVKHDGNISRVNATECMDKKFNRGLNICKESYETYCIESDDKSTKKDVNNCNIKLPEINVTDLNFESRKKDIKCSKRKLVKNNIEEQTKEKKGRAWRKKPFNKEQGFKEFEEKFHFKIVTVSEEDMVTEMENRKKSDNYKLSAFKCQLCFKGFLSQNTYDNHMKLHDPARGNECRLCHKRYFRPAGLRCHVRDHHQLRFHCLRCDQTLNSKYSAEMHAQFHAGKVFQCDHCGQQFRKPTTCNTHMRVSHPLEAAEGATCALCGEVFLSAAGLRMHKSRSHEPLLPTLRCRTCKLRFESSAAIDRHRRAQPAGKCDNRHSSCTQCGEAFASEQDLLTHRIEQHALQLFTCDMCNKSFESKASVATHIERVHRLLRPAPARPPPGPRPRPPPPGRRQPPPRRPRKQCDAICEICGKRSTCMATLKIHMNTHTGARPYKCSLCPKTYLTPHGLKTHEPVHSGARKWSCEECHATFMRQSSLSLHRRAVHSGERAYQCHICSKTFTQSGSLYTHVKYVHMKVKPPPRKRNKKTAT